MVVILHKMKEVGWPLATSTFQPILSEMIESLALDVFFDNKYGGFEVTWEWSR